MPHPKKRKTRSGIGQRRSHSALKKFNLSSCPKCKAAVLPHRACSICGTYAGKEAIKIKIKKRKGQKTKPTKETKEAKEKKS